MSSSLPSISIKMTSSASSPSSFLSSNPRPFHFHTKSNSYPKPALPSSSRPLRLRPITASVSEPPSFPATTPFSLPVRDVPGDPGLPLIQPFLDRLDYFYNLGRDNYFQSKINKYKSTVFRAFVPPGPSITSHSSVVVLLDGKSFPVLFDVSKVDKRDLFTGTFMPSTELTGGYRMLSYLDPSEPNHAKLKTLLFNLLKSSRNDVVPEFRKSYSSLFDTFEAELAGNGRAEFEEANDQAMFNFLARAFYKTDPADTGLGSAGPTLIKKWILFQLAPILCLGLPKCLEEITIHSFRLPPPLIKKDYNRLYEFFYNGSSRLLDDAARDGISRDEACHNLVFATCFNTYGGMKKLFPSLMKWIGEAGSEVHAKLAMEIRGVIKSNGGEVTMASMEKMTLMKSVVYETLRIDPPVPLQFARAKRDLIIESHESAFRVKKGEFLFGFQPFATKDPRIFDRPQEFIPDRFVGEEGEKLLRRVYWSNGPETEGPSVNNKQCAGKDFVILVSRLLIVEVFRRYDSFRVEAGTTPLGVSVIVTSLEKASF